jgi:hypothetical protein
MFIFHFNGGSGKDYVVIADSHAHALLGLSKMGVSKPELLDCMLSAPIHHSEVVTIRCRQDQSFYINTSRTPKED